MYFSLDFTKNLSRSVSLIERKDKSFFPRVKNALEIGCYEGSGTRFIYNQCKKSPSFEKLYVVDPWDDSYNEKLSTFDVLYYDQYDRFMRNTKDIRNNLVIIPGKSSEEIPKLPQNLLFDFVYIDGDHHASSYYTDGKNVLERLSEGGYILFDDYLWQENSSDAELTPKKGIDQFLDEFENDITIENMDFQVLVKKK
jgi:predicted O-methyltransferase YrrM